MTEKRFWYDFEDVNGHKIVDFKNDKEYPLETIGDFREVVDLLNELQIKCDNKQEHIVVLENKIHRMREDIKRLEALYHYRGYIGSGDVKKEYYRMEKLLKAENDKLEKENGELKQSVNNFKDTIIKIIIAYQRKYDRNIVDLVHEIYEEDISDLIKGLKE